MTRIIYALFFLPIFFSCTKETQESMFSRYCATLKTIRLPYELRCGLWKRDYENTDQDTSLQSRFGLPPQVVGRLYPGERIVTLLNGIPGDDLYPQLLTFSPSGTPIDTLFLGGSCQAEPGYLASSTVLLNSDKTIILTDTVWTWALDSLSDENPNTKSTSVEIRKYDLDSLGRFHETYTNKANK